jgi:hypothetical protein
MTLFKIATDNVPHQLPQKDFESRKYEENLEAWIEKCPEILSEEGENLLIIGRQVTTGFQKAIDLLALDQFGNTVVIELKRGRSPREIIAQSLEYTAWVKTLREDGLEEIARKYFRKRDEEFSGLKAIFGEYFGVEIANVEFNTNQRIIIVAQEIAPEVKLVAGDLIEKGYEIQLLAFSYFQTEKEELLQTELILRDEKRYETIKKKSQFYNFFKDVEGEVREKLSGDLAQIKTSSGAKIMQLWYPGLRSKHFEIWFHTQKKEAEFLEIGLHLEPVDEKLFQYFKRKEREIKQKLGKDVKIEQWGKKWARVYEWIPKDKVDPKIVARKMVKYISFLFPMLKET